MLRLERQLRMLLMRDSAERPFLKMGPRVGRHAARREQHGSMVDQVRILATVAETYPTSA